MTIIAAIASGNASSTATWGGGVIPVSGDRVLIPAGVNVTLDAAYTWGDDSTGTVVSPTITSFQGTISGSVLTVTSITSGSPLGPAQAIAGTSVTAGTTITSFGTGTGGTGTYNLSKSSTVSTAEAMTSTYSTTHSVEIWGTLTASTTASSSLTGYGNIYVGVGGLVSAGSSSTPLPTGITFSILPGDSATLAAGKYGLYVDNGASFQVYGTAKQRISTLTAAIASGVNTFTVANASGWAAGDTLFLANTQTTVNALGGEVVTIQSLSGNTITTTANTVYSHALSCPVANVTSNVTVEAFNTTYPGYCFMTGGNLSQSGQVVISNAAFWNLSITYPYNGATFSCTANYGATYYTNPFTISSSAFYSSSARGVYFSGGAGSPVGFASPIPLTNCAMVSVVTAAGTTKAISDIGNTSFSGCLASCNTGYNYTGQSSSFTNGWLVADAGAAPLMGTGQGLQMSGTILLGGSSDQFLVQATSPGLINAAFSGLDINSTFPRPAGTPLIGTQSVATGINLTATDCLVGTAPTFSSLSSATVMTNTSLVSLVNKNNNALLQEDWYYNGTVFLNTANTYRSKSSAQLQVTAPNVPFSPVEPYPIGPGQTLTFVGAILYDAAYYNGGVSFVAPTITLSGTVNGVALTPATYTCASANAGNWNLYTLSITNTQSAAGTISIKANIQSAVTTGNVYYDGLDYGRFVTFSRHYGYIFNEAVAAQVTNPYTVATESAANAYTGIYIAWGASSSPVTITGNTTFQQTYDYSQAQACINLNSVVPFTGQGAVGAVSLSLAASFSINSGVTLNGSGSIATNAQTLSGFIGTYPFTYTNGGAYSQATTEPNFGGGTLGLSAEQAYTFTGSSLIIEFTPSAAGTYNLSGATLAGTIDLRNTTSYAITVQLASGVTYTTANNTGGAITVSAPQPTQSVTLNNLVANSQVWIYDQTSSTVLANVNIGAATTYTWTDSAPATASRTIEIRVANVQGTTAYEFIDEVIGTLGTSFSNATITYLVNQVLDTIYNTIGISGSTVTGMSIVGTALELDITSSSATFQQIYAWMVYWLSTSTGIADQTTEVTASSPTNFTFNNSFTIKNTSSPSVPLLVTGGNATNVAGTPITILNTSGGTIFINSAIVVPFSTGSGLTPTEQTQLQDIYTYLGTPTTTIAQELSQKLNTSLFLAL